MVGTWQYVSQDDSVILCAVSAKLHGVPEGKLSYEQWLGCVDESQRERVGAQVLAQIRNEGALSIEYDIGGADSASRLLLSWAKDSLANSDGQLVNALIVDITNRAGFESALLSNVTALTEQLRRSMIHPEAEDESAACCLAVVEAALDGIIVINLRGTIEQVNPATARIFGYTSGELIGNNVRMLMPEPYRAEHDEYLDNYLQTGVKKIIGIGREVVGKRKDGSTFPLDLAVTEVSYRNRRLFAGTVRDISERKEAEDRIVQLNEYLEQRVAERTEELTSANHELDAFAYSVSHDLRAPLRHVDGFIELLQHRIEGAIDDKSRHYLETIAESARRMGALIDDLLAFSRMGRTDVEKAEFDLFEIVDGVRRDLTSECEGRSVEWNIQPLPRVWADRSLMTMVWTNLLSNAVKFTRACDEAVITIGAKTDDPHRQTFFISDNGVGFDMQYADKLFGVFQRLHRAEDFEGTGIGLANVRRIVQRHGGAVWAEAELEKGATFYVTLPKREDNS